MTISSRTSNECSRSRCKDKSKRSVIQKCKYFFKYIFCCGGYCKKMFRRKQRNERPRSITRKAQQFEYIKNHTEKTRYK